MEDICRTLNSMRDEAYAEFQRRLIPNVPAQSVLGIRVPALRSYAKKISGTPSAEAFLQSLPHKTYDENNLHGFLISLIRDFDKAVAAVDAFLPYVDNWATCDMMSPNVFGKHRPQLMSHCRRWIASGETYTVRFSVKMLMRWFLDEAFEPQPLQVVAAVKSDEYYVNMMLAWFFATALAKQPDATLPYLQQHVLSKWVHNKTIQKAVESYRITDAQKDYLRTLKER